MGTHTHTDHPLLRAAPAARAASGTAQPPVNGQLRPAARASSQKEAGPGARDAARARGPCEPGGGASACAEGSKEKAGKDRMERQGVSDACFPSRGGRRAAGGRAGNGRDLGLPWRALTQPLVSCHRGHPSPGRVPIS